MPTARQKFHRPAGRTGLYRLVAAVAVCAALAGCGGGSSGSASVSEVAASGFAPSSAVPGATVTVTGSGMSRVRSVAIAGFPASFEIESDSQISVTVPSGVNTPTAAITLAGAGFSVQATSELTLDIPSLSWISASRVTVGSTFSVAGTNLDRVATFSVGGVAFPADQVTPTSATLTAPAAQTAGFVVLTDAAGHSYTSSYGLASYGPLLVGSLSRSTAVAGDTVTVYGTGLDAVQSIAFANGAAGTITARTSTALNFTVPALAIPAGQSAYLSALTLTSPLGRATSDAVLAVGPSITVATTSATVSGSTMTITITGSRLSLVNAAAVDSTVATLVSASDAVLTLAVPASASGTVTLGTPYQTAVPAGSVSGSSAATFALSELDISQVFNRNGADTALRLSPGRPALVRAYLAATATGIASPAVSLVVSNGGAYLGTLAMSGPGTIPTSVSAYKLATTYNVTVPGSWMTRGVRLQVTVAGSAQTVAATPAIGAAARIHVVLVPLTIGGATGSLPATSSVHDTFARTYPLASADIAVTTRAAFGPTGVASISRTSDASNALSQLETLRSQENPDAFYYGVFSSSIDTSNLLGLGYVGVPGYEKQSAASALGIDSTTVYVDVDPFKLKIPEWASTMIHEVGHNHSLRHAPCGNPGDPDPAYPYAGGVLGPQGVYNSLYADGTSIGGLSSPTVSGHTMTDAMGYCGGYMFSDYNYAKAQAFAEARTAAVPTPLVRASATTTGARLAPDGYLVLSGSFGPDGVRLDPAHATGVAPRELESTTPYALRVTTESGQSFDHPVLMHAVGDGDDRTRFFARTIPNPGAIASVEVVPTGARRTTVGPTMRPASVARGGSRAARAATWSESGGSLAVAWNTEAEPYAAVTHVAADGTRTVLALRAQGGTVDLDTRPLAPGGHFEIVLSSATGARLVRVAR